MPIDISKTPDTVDRVEIVTYVRGSSGDELASDIETVLTYCRNQLEREWLTDEYIDAVEQHLIAQLSGAAPEILTPPDVIDPDSGIVMTADYQKTGELDGLAAILDGAEAHPQTRHVVTPNVSRLIDPQDRTLENVRTLVEDIGVSVHFPRDGISIHEGTDINGQILRALTALGGAVIDIGYAESWTGGRPPLGFEAGGSQLEPAENFDQVAEILQGVTDGDLSKYAAANKLDCSWGTIDRALDRPQLYGIEA